MDTRPNPDQLLQRVQADDASATRGRLKLFFGASPGVGKTYAMLEAARQRRKEGWDVVIGLVETHGRTETQALLDGLEILPRRKISYHTVILEEFDLDGALQRRPRLIIVDELAHTNTEGSRHAKRWQDIEELLNAGIDVYTTLNVQHWESLNDVVTQITGIAVRETVPDTFLQRTHDLELVDLAPEDLLQRLKDGKVYKQEMAGRAADNFFKPGNLIALRELALRHAAERVDEQMQAYKERNAIQDVWAVGERLLVGVSGSPLSVRLIRATSRLANRFKAPWIALHVETPAFLASDFEARDRTINNMRMAESLGADVVTVTGAHVTEELLAYARSHNVTQIILGKPAHPKWKERIFGSILSDVARQSGNMGLHVISGEGLEVKGSNATHSNKPMPWARFLSATGIAAFISLLSWPLSYWLDRSNIVMIYLLGVVLTAYWFGRRAAFIGSVLSVLCFDFFFVPPKLTFAVGDSQYLLTFAIMLAVGLLISTMMGRLRGQTSALRERAERIRSLYKLSRALSEIPEPRRMLQMACTHLEKFYQRPILILTANSQGTLDINAGDALKFGWNDNELSVARWTYDHNQMAGAGSDTLNGATGLYLPMRGIHNTVGVIGVNPDSPRTWLEPERLQLLETFVSEIGGALESTRMSEAMGRAEVQMEQNALQNISAASSTSLKDLLVPQNIVLLEHETSKEEIIRILLSKLSVPNPQAALRAIFNREKAGATNIGDNVAIPHARIDGLKSIQVALAVTRSGAPGIWLLFLSPTAEPKLHLQFLAQVAGFFQNEKNIERLLCSRSQQQIVDLLH